MQRDFTGNGTNRWPADGSLGLFLDHGVYSENSAWRWRIVENEMAEPSPFFLLEHHLCLCSKSVWIKMVAGQKQMSDNTTCFPIMCVLGGKTPFETGDLLFMSFQISARAEKGDEGRINPGAFYWERLVHAENLTGFHAPVSLVEVRMCKGFFLHCALWKHTCHSKTQGRERASPEKVRYVCGGIRAGILKMASISSRHIPWSSPVC